VWISTPDGSTERPLTAGGGFSSPSMADDGTIVALRGRSFVRLRPDGAAIGMPLRASGRRTAAAVVELLDDPRRRAMLRRRSMRLVDGRGAARAAAAVLSFAERKRL